MNSESIVEFWRWFETVAPTLDGGFTKPIVDELDRRIVALGLSWELGPGTTAKNALVISPGSLERLEVTKAIIGLAPTIEGWEFLPSKPPKRWKGTFRIPLAGQPPIDVDIGTWRYVVLRYPDGAKEIVIETRDLVAYTEERQHWIVEVVLDSLLGEEKRLRTIDFILIVPELDPEQAEAASLLTDLQQ